MTECYHSSNLRKHRRSEGSGVWLITKKTAKRSDLLCNPGPDGPLAMVIAETLAHAVRTSKVQLAAFVIMPDHWHAVIGMQPINGENLRVSLSKQMKVMNSWISRNTGIGWQDGFHDTRIRSGRQFNHMVNYVEWNPAESGHVSNRLDWPWSSVSPVYEDILTRPWPWHFELDE